MYKVYWTDLEGRPCGIEFEDMIPALEHTNYLRKTSKQFVCLVSELKDCVSKAGVDAVVDGVLPDGNKYTWRKRR